jgi:hypothetical protein
MNNLFMALNQGLQSSRHTTSLTNASKLCGKSAGMLWHHAISMLHANIIGKFQEKIKTLKSPIAIVIKLKVSSQIHPINLFKSHQNQLKQLHTKITKSHSHGKTTCYSACNGRFFSTRLNSTLNTKAC